MKQLEVYLGEDRVGRLNWTDENRLIFQYDPGYLAKGEIIALSKSLPLQEAPFPGRPVQTFFRGILPEGEPRHQLAAILGISEENTFSFLERIGGECAGAVSLWSEGERPSPEASPSVRKLTDDELEDILSALPQRPLQAGVQGIRLSLAGAQDKLPVLKEGNHYALPLGDTPSSHILKPEPSRFPGLVENEFLCLELARRVGHSVSSSEMKKIGNVRFLEVSRYDRTISDGGRIQRLHQEDFCQALAVLPERKYQVEGGPGVADCVTLLRKWSTLPAKDTGRWLDGLLINLLLGNADAHGKNSAFIYNGPSRRLAPSYDIVSTLAWPNLSSRLAMKVGSAWELREVDWPHLRQMASESSLAWSVIRKRMKELANLVGNELSGTLFTEGENSEMKDQMRDLILRQVKRFRTD